MTDRLFTAALTFILLAGGTCAIGAALFGLDRPAAPRHDIAVVQLPRVEITARREVAPAAPAAADAAVVALPRVEIVGRRPAGFAFVDAGQTDDGARAARPAEVEAARVATARAVRAGEDDICIE